jgi:hypothetical protein
MNIEESQLRQIIREELSKPPGWVEPPPGWTWNSQTLSYDSRGGSVIWSPEELGPMGQDGKYTQGCWVWTDGMYNEKLLNPQEGFEEKT